MPEQKACTTEEKVLVIMDPTTKAGKPANVDGPIRVTVQSGGGTAVMDEGEPLQFWAVSSDDLGETVYLVEADADLGEGVRDISDTFTLVVGSATAENFGMRVGEPVQK